MNVVVETVAGSFAVDLETDEVGPWEGVIAAPAPPAVRRRDSGDGKGPFSIRDFDGGLGQDPLFAVLNQLDIGLRTPVGRCAVRAV